VRMSIFQPRLSNYTSFEMQAEDLITWGEDYVKPKAELAFIGGGDFVAGSHCKFCKLRNNCKTLANNQMEAAKKAFAEPNTLTDQEIADILEKAADVKAWLSSIQEYALAEALKGKKWPGHKLVAGRSNRVLTQPEEIVKVLKKAKIEGSLYLTEPKLLGIGALEKNIGKTELDKLIAPYIIKPPGAPALVPAWDKRPEIASLEDAQKAFEGCVIS